MSPRRTRRGTVRESVSEISVDKSLKSASKTTRRTRNTNKSQNIKSSEEESDSPVQVNDSIAEITATSNKNNTSTRRRKRKNDQDNTLSETLDESKVSLRKRNNSKASRSTRHAKNNKSQVSDANSIMISEDESFNTKTRKDKTQVSSKKRVKLDIHNDSSVKKESRSSEKASPSKSLTENELSDEKVTPKSSPINIPLNPHRSTKTPKKSPINIGSPKTHSKHFLKSLKVPRKLTIADSPPSEKSNDSILQQSDLSNINNESINSKKNNSKNSKQKTSNKKLSVSPTFKVKPRFSKSPKIVFKTSKFKSPKSNKKSPTKKSSSKISIKSLENSLSTIEIPVLSDSMEKLETSVENNSPSKSDRNSKNASLKKGNSLSPEKILNTSHELQKSSETKSPNKSQTSSTNISLLKLEKSPKIILPILPENLSLKSPNETSLLSKSISPKKNTSNKPKKSPKIKSSKNLSSSSSKTPKNVSITSKKSPKFISPFNPKKTPKIMLTLKSKKSPLKSSRSSLSSKLKKSPAKKSPVKKEKVSVTKESQKSISSSDLSASLSMSPRVIVNKLISPDYKQSLLDLQKNSPSVNLIPVDHKDKKSIVINLTSQKTDTPSISLDKKSFNMRPLTSSTPREKIKQKPSSNSVSPNSKAKISRRFNNQSKLKTNNQLLEDESEPSMNDSSLIHMSDVYNSDNSQNNVTSDEKNNSHTTNRRKSKDQINNSQSIIKNNTYEIEDNDSKSPDNNETKKDGTYEVENPKTPKFQKRSNKRTIEETELSENEGQQSKRSKVHFVTPSSAIKFRSSGINRLGTPGHAIQKRKTSILTNNLRTPLNNQSLLNKEDNKKRLSSAVKMQLKTPNSSIINKRQSKSISDAKTTTNKNNQLSSVNRLSRPKSIVNSEKKLATKTPVRKIPNFAEIHQKNFAKMESLVDLKKRVKERHVTLNAPSSSTKKTSESTNGVYNRFGFKLRKDDAVDIMSKKQLGNVNTREKRREDTRSTLKGVRMNRRFELQMKSRMKPS